MTKAAIKGHLPALPIFPLATLSPNILPSIVCSDSGEERLLSYYTSTSVARLVIRWGQLALYAPPPTLIVLPTTLATCQPLCWK